MEQLVDLESLLTQSPSAFVETVNKLLSHNDWQSQLNVIAQIQKAATVSPSSDCCTCST